MATYRKYPTKGVDADPDIIRRHDYITAWDKTPEIFGSYLSCGFPKEIVDPNLNGTYELPPANAQDWGSVRHANPPTFNDKPKSHPPAPGKVGAE